MDYVLAYLMCFSLGALTTYMDIISFFSKRKIGVASIIRVISADAFIAVNGLLGVALLVWSLSDPEAKINTILSFESAIGKGLLIGISIPAIIRSKWFSVGSKENDNPAGLETIYQWFRKKVLMHVHIRSLDLKRGIAHRYALLLQGDKAVLAKVHDRVSEYLKPFMNNQEELDELEREYENINEAYSDSHASDEHLERLFTWAIDHTELAWIKKYLKELVDERNK